MDTILLATSWIICKFYRMILVTCRNSILQAWPRRTTTPWIWRHVHVKHVSAGLYHHGNINISTQCRLNMCHWTQSSLLRQTQESRKWNIIDYLVNVYRMLKSIAAFTTLVFCLLSQLLPNTKVNIWKVIENVSVYRVCCCNSIFTWSTEHYSQKIVIFRLYI